MQYQKPRTINVDISRENIGSTVGAIQGDGSIRQVLVQLQDNGVNWLPPVGAWAEVKYVKPDGTIGLYDMLADNTPAVLVRGSVATVFLAAQMLTAPGKVAVSITFTNAQLDQVTTFPFFISVKQNIFAGAQKSEDYIKLQWLEDKLDEYLKKAKDSGVFNGPKGDAFTYEDFTPEQLAALTGPQGPIGQTGPQGPKGENGDQGPAGDNTAALAAAQVANSAAAAALAVVDTVVPDVNELKQTIADLEKRTYNLYNKKDVTFFECYMSASIIRKGNSTTKSFVLPVHGGKKYRIQRKNICARLGIGFTSEMVTGDDQQPFLANASIYSNNELTRSVSVTAPAEAAYMYVWYYNGTYDVSEAVALEEMMISEGDEEKAYLPKYIISVEEANLSDDIRNRISKLFGLTTLNGKSWFAIGDSLTDKSTLGNENKNYTNIVAERLGLTMTNKGVAGTGYWRKNSSRTDGKPFYERVAEYTDNPPDIITVFGSLNDLGRDTSDEPFGREILGTASDTTSDTVGGCINQTIDNIIAFAPNAVIGIIAPTQWNGYYNNAYAKQYVSLLHEIAESRGIPFLDLFHHSNLRPNDAAFRSTYYKNGDGIHPNTLGHERISGLICDFINSISGCL